MQMMSKFVKKKTTKNQAKIINEIILIGFPVKTHNSFNEIKKKLEI